jgi:hypothetical protein
VVYQWRVSAANLEINQATDLEVNEVNPLDFYQLSVLGRHNKLNYL